MTKTYYIVRASGSWGPLSAQEIRAMALRGQLKPEDGIRQVGQDQVHRADTIAGLFSGTGANVAAPSAPPAAASTNTVTAAGPMFRTEPAHTLITTTSAGGASSSSDPVTRLLTTLVLLQLEDLSGRVDRGEITEQRYQQVSGLLFEQLRSAEAVFAGAGAAKEIGFSPASLQAPSVGFAQGPSAASEIAGAAGSLALGAAIGLAANRALAPSTSAASSGTISRGAGPAVPRDSEPSSVWDNLIAGSERLAKGWSAWKGLSSAFGGSSSNSVTHTAAASTPVQAPGGISPNSAAQYASRIAAAPSPEPIYEAETIDASAGEEIETAELVDAPAYAAPEPAFEPPTFDPPPIDSPTTYAATSFAETPAETPETPTESILSSWFGGDNATVETAAEGGDWFGGSEEAVEAAGAGGEWFGGDVGDVDVGGVADVGVDLSGLDASGFEF